MDLTPNTEDQSPPHTPQWQAEVLDKLPQAILVTNRDGIIQYANQALELMFAYLHNELLGKQITQLYDLSPGEKEQKLLEISETLSSQSIWIGENYSIRKDGTTFLLSTIVCSRSINGETYMIHIMEGEFKSRKIEEKRRFLIPISEEISFSGLRILVVDDDPDTRDMIAIFLQQYGAEVISCSSAAEALAIISHDPPDVLLADIHMPEEDGYSLIRKVRSLDPQHGGAVPAIALTVLARSADRVRALAAGYQAIIPKPIEFEELALVIANLVRSYLTR